MTPEQAALAAVLPRYDIAEEIGRGGWGVVYKGWHRDLRRPVAIKQLPAAFGADASVRDRFIAEAQLVAALEHPHIVPLYDFAERDGIYVIVMELATGSVWNRFEAQGVQTDEAVATVLAAAVGLHYAHSRGLLHRDVKPDNLLYSASGTVKVADFGIAKSMNEADGARTATNTVIGSPAYMAPEQILGKQLAPATDIYALGIVTYQLLSGHLPYPVATELMTQLYQHVNEQPRPLVEVAPHVPVELGEVVHRALQKEPSDRPQTAEQYATELAAAGAAAFGPGWLERTGMAVMGSTPVIAATERNSVSVPAAGNTVLIRPDELERQRHAQPFGAAGRPDPQPAAAPAAAATSPSSHSAGPVPAPRADQKGLPIIAIGGALAAIAAVVIAVILFSGGGDGNGPDTTPAGESDAETVTAAEQAMFRSLCDSQGVGTERCSCALTRSLDQLDAESFRTSLDFMVRTDGDIDATITAIFDSCVADGF